MLIPSENYKSKQNRKSNVVGFLVSTIGKSFLLQKRAKLRNFFLCLEENADYMIHWTVFKPIFLHQLFDRILWTFSFDHRTLQDLFDLIHNLFLLLHCRIKLIQSNSIAVLLSVFPLEHFRFLEWILSIPRVRDLNRFWFRSIHLQVQNRNEIAHQTASSHWLNRNIVSEKTFGIQSIRRCLQWNDSSIAHNRCVVCKQGRFALRILNQSRKKLVLHERIVLNRKDK